MFNVIIDTNVFISGLLTSGKSRSILRGLNRGAFRLLISEELLEELVFTLGRPEFHRLVPPQDIQALFATIKGKTVFVHPKIAVNICRDAKDNPLLSCALAGRADFLVSGDKDLLVLKSFEGTRIVSPREFFEILRK